jgi:N-acetyl-alpha-D-glucosaminyl L-malate synthase BshA
MKIGITCYPTYGGSGVVATELGKKLAEIGHEIHFISYALPYRLNTFTNNIFFHEVDVLHYPLFEYPPYSLSLASKMAEIIEYQDLDLLHVHYAIPHATSAFLARQLLDKRSIKIITTLHGTDITLLGSDPSFFKITKFSIEQSDGITAVSNYLKEETRNVFGIKKHIEVIPNFIPIEISTPINRSELRGRFARPDEFLITHISNFRALKRISDIVPIAENVLRKHKIKVLMVGDGPERYHAEEQARGANISDRVIFLGKQENIKDLLAITDIALFPSASESFGLAALESMAFGIPVVSSNAGGLNEVNQNTITGFTINVGDIDGFSDALNKLLDDPEMRKRMGIAAQKFARDQYAAEKVIPHYLQYYESVIRG